MLYEIIQMGSVFFPRKTNIKTGQTSSAWEGYCSTKEEAMVQLVKKMEDDAVFRLKLPEVVVHSVVVEVNSLGV